MMLKLYFLGFLIKSLLTIGIETQPAHGSLKPRNVQFQSRNFHNILRWQPGSFFTGNGSVYFVQYKMYGQRQWKNKTDCWGTTALFCDLTNETLDLYEPYYGRVMTARAGSYSAWSMTPRFTPWWETKLDPPAVTTVPVNGSLLVLLRAPELPYRNRKGNNTSTENYYNLVYRVFVIDKLVEKSFIFPEKPSECLYQHQNFYEHAFLCVSACNLSDSQLPSLDFLA
ncbi:hypothetical protein ACRRTK_001383 [Alexandromys fortis]